MDNKQYSIRTVKDMVAVINEENVDRFLVDLRDYILHCRKNRIVTAEKLGVPTGSLQADGFIWVDDGKIAGPIRNQITHINGKVEEITVNRDEL